MPYNRDYDTIFFDMGSTLVGLRAGWHSVYHRVFQRAGFDLPLDEVEAAVSASWQIADHPASTVGFAATLEGSHAWQRIVEERVMHRLGIEPPHHDRLFQDLVQAFESPATYQLYSDVLPTLEYLQKVGYRLAIISNWGWHLPELCAGLGLANWFEQIFTSARIGCQKPDPRIFQQALATMQTQPERALHIGDSLSADVMGAQSVGISALWLVRPNETPLYTTKTDLKQSVTKISTLLEILDFVKAKN